MGVNESNSHFEETVTAYLDKWIQKQTLPDQIQEKEEYHKRLQREFNNSPYLNMMEAVSIYKAREEVSDLTTLRNRVDEELSKTEQELTKYFKSIMNKKVRIDYQDRTFELYYGPLGGLTCTII